MVWYYASQTYTPFLQSLVDDKVLYLFIALSNALLWILCLVNPIVTVRRWYGVQGATIVLLVSMSVFFSVACYFASAANVEWNNNIALCYLQESYDRTTAYCQPIRIGLTLIVCSAAVGIALSIIAVLWNAGILCYMVSNYKKQEQMQQQHEIVVDKRHVQYYDEQVQADNEESVPALYKPIYGSSDA